MFERFKNNKIYKTVKIRTWEDMSSQYGLNDFQHIRVGMSWSKQSERSLPKNRIIKVEVVSGSFTPYKWYDLFISEDMLVPNIKLLR